MPPQVVALLAAGHRAPGLLAEAIEAYWQVAITPWWPRMCGVLEDDVAHRAAMSLRAGLFGLLSDLHPEVTLAPDSRLLRIDKPRFPDATYRGAALTLVPSVFVWPRLVVSHSQPDAFELTYAARGVARVWEGMNTSRPEGDSLAALLGRSRATILTLVHVPMSTTQIARSVGQSPGSVSQHLAVLRESGMVTSRRAGRSVLYRQTALGQSLVAVNRAGEPAVRAVDS
jgi:DNA-binding transcriptional ArsR family regulator